MSSVITHLFPADQADQQAVGAQHYRRLLHELIDTGSDLARAAHQLATAHPEVAVAAAVAFVHLSRGVRRAITLARRIAEPAPDRPDSSRQRAAARRRIIRDVEDVIRRTAGGAEAERLRAELAERLDEPELEDELDSRPAAEIIAEICRDFGIAARDLGAAFQGIGSRSGDLPWKRRAPRDLEALCARAARSCAPPESGAAGADAPSSPPDAGADLLHFTPPVRSP